MGGRLRGRNSKRTVRRSDETRDSGASRSSLGVEGLVGGEHVPDRFGEFAGDVDLRDFRGARRSTPACT
jgi:hypothetical protein